ncbi:MAG: gaf sensor signal transduction histidine kinase [Ignavibacteria bacterium]|nr:MAG: gaf sensor signal transduction histidine kinase [Ignavibacteria bacterium]
MNLQRIKGRLITIGEGEILYREGDYADHIFLVISGEINLLKKRLLGKTKSYIFNESDFFGQEEFFEETSRTSTAVALRDTYLISLMKEEIDELIRQDHQVMLNMREPMAEIEEEAVFKKTSASESIKEEMPVFQTWSDPIKEKVKTQSDTKIEDHSNTHLFFQSISDSSRFEEENLVHQLEKVEDTQQPVTLADETNSFGTDIFNEDGILKAEFELPDDPPSEVKQPDIIADPMQTITEEVIPFIEMPHTGISAKPDEDLNDALFNMLSGSSLPAEILLSKAEISETSDSIFEEPSASPDLAKEDNKQFFTAIDFDQQKEAIQLIKEEQKFDKEIIQTTDAKADAKQTLPPFNPTFHEYKNEDVFAETEAQIKAVTNEEITENIVEEERHIIKPFGYKLPASEDSRMTKDELEMILRAAEMVNSTIKIDELLGSIVDVAAELTGADRGTLYLVDKDKNELWSLVLIGNNSREIRLRIGDGLAGYVAQSGETLNIKDVQVDPRFNKDFDRTTGYVTKNMICFPIKNNTGVIIGVLQLLNSKNGEFSSRDEVFLAALSVHSAIALQNAELVEKLLTAERVHSLGKMANFLIQDIKKPVLVSKRYAEHLLNKQLPQDSIQIVEMLLEQLVQVAEIVQTTSSYSEGKTLLRSINVSLNNTLADYASRVETFVVSRNCIIYNEFEKDVTVKVDIKEFFQCYLHIIKNACDAMPEGGSIYVSTKKENKNVKILFRDNGLGVPEGFNEKIFEPFMSYGKKEGTGLGLAITKKIVEAHKGKIEVESTTGTGAVFIITLPVASLF